MNTTLVIAADFPPARLEAELAGLGWAAADGGADEAGRSRWTHAAGAELLRRDDAARGLLVLEVRGAGAARQADELAARVPTLSPADVRRLLRSREPGELLRGLAAAEALGALPLLPEVAALTEHADARVAAAAGEVFGKLFAPAFELARRRIGAENALHPERSALFAHLETGARRQTLRWLAHDLREADENVLRVLRAGLADEDWEVRATAVLAAARLRASSLAPLVRGVRLPEDGRSGLGPDERRILEGLRRASLLLLEGHAPPEIDDDDALHEEVSDETEARPSREAVRAHLMRCAAGLPVARHDRAFLLAHALTTPLQPGEPPPAELPRAVREAGGRFYLAETGVELVWVPPVAHWLGDELERKFPENPIREARPGAGFFAARAPLGREDGGGESSRRADFHTCSWWDARRLCDALSQREGAEVTLPTADEWEMLARGPDGRRFPWGNALERGMLELPSPWDALRATGCVRQWTATLAPRSAAVVTRGGPRELLCALITPLPPDSEGVAVRPVVKLTP